MNLSKLPEIKEASSLARKATALETSSGTPRRVTPNYQNNI